MEMFRIGSDALPLLDALFRGKRDIQNLLSLTVGDRLQGQVAGKLGEGRVLLTLEGVQVEAETTMPLQNGQKINVRVESLTPQVMLRLLAEPAQNDAEKNVSQYLKFFRSNPQAPADLFQSGITLLKPGNMAALSNSQIRDQAQALEQLLHSLIFSDKTAKNPLFVRDFVQRSGLILENLLSQNLIKSDVLPQRPGLILENLLNQDTTKSDVLSQRPGSIMENILIRDTAKSDALSQRPGSIMENILIRDAAKSDALLQRSGSLLENLLSRNITKSDSLPQRSGLILENLLSRNPAIGDFLPPSETANLKGALMKLAADIQNGIAARPDIPEPERQALMRLADYAERSVRTLETQQVINTVMRENENRFLLQIPFAFPHDTVTQDIFIEFDDSGKEKNGTGERPFRIVFFLLLDVLGEIVIDVSIKGQELMADLSCQREEIASLVRNNIGDLQENLESLGFRIAGMTCNVRADIAERKQNYIRNVSCYGEEVLNVFA